MKPIRQRAKTPEQKAARRQHILEAAAEIIMDSSFDQLNMIEIAQQVGITKAALYRYFRNKESLFLALYEQSLDELIKASDEAPDNIQDPAKDLADRLLQHRLFCHLTAILNAVLERNLTVEEAIEFKLRLTTRMVRFTQIMSRRLDIENGEALALLFHIQNCIIGCWHTCNPVGTMKEALESPALSMFRLDFDTNLKAHLQLLTDGFNSRRIAK